MRRSLPILLAVLGAAALGAPAFAKEPHERLLKEKADLVVSVKFTLQTTFSRGGQSQERETAISTTGILVDKSGLVMISNSSLNPSFFPRGMGGMDVKSTPSQFRVVFPGDAKEYPAILGATESKIGLAFVRLRDLEGKTITALGGEPAPEPGAGDVLYGVSRLPEGFDYAPYVDELRVSGRLTKPRDLINVEGSFTHLAHPVFDASGGIVGVLVSQQGVGESGAGTFVLPWKTAAGTVQRALKASETALEEAKKKEAEEPPSGEKPAEEEPADGKPSDGKPSDEKPAGEEPADGK